MLKNAHCRLGAFFGAAILVAACNRLVVAAPATQPADADSPQQFVAALTNDKVAAMTADQSTAILAYDASSDKEKSDARAVAANSVAASKLEVAARKKWGKDVEADLAHAIGDTTPEDIAQADWAVDGDHAVAQFKSDNLAPLALIKKGGQWKLDLPGEWKLMGETVDDDIKGEQVLSKLLDEFNQNLANKDAYPTADAFVQHVKDELGKLKPTE